MHSRGKWKIHSISPAAGAANYSALFFTKENFLKTENSHRGNHFLFTIWMTDCQSVVFICFLFLLSKNCTRRTQQRFRIIRTRRTVIFSTSWVYLGRREMAFPKKSCLPVARNRVASQLELERRAWHCSGSREVDLQQQAGEKGHKHSHKHTRTRWYFTNYNVESPWERESSHPAAFFTMYNNLRYKTNLARENATASKPNRGKWKVWEKNRNDLWIWFRNEIACLNWTKKKFTSIFFGISSACIKKINLAILLCIRYSQANKQKNQFEKSIKIVRRKQLSTITVTRAILFISR